MTTLGYFPEWLRNRVHARIEAASLNALLLKPTQKGTQPKKGEVNMTHYNEHITNPAQKNPFSIGGPTQIERRRTTRYHFVSAIEVITVESQKQVISLTRDLSLCGCFVTVKAPSPKGTRVSLKIADSRANFSAVGKVIHNLSDEGIGIGFVQVEAKDQAVLEEWLAEANANGAVT